MHESRRLICKVLVYSTLLVKHLFAIQIFYKLKICYKAKDITSTHMLVFPLYLFTCVLMEMSRSLF